MQWRENSENVSLSWYVKSHLKLAEKKYWSPCNFEKTQVPLGWPKGYKFYRAAQIALLDI